MKKLIECILENRGHDFETKYVSEFETKYRKGLEDMLGFENNELKDSELKHLGGKNSSRPLQTINNTLSIGSKNIEKTVGDDVVDILLTNATQNIMLNLSLKYGRTITFLNCGISQAFPKECFDEYAESKAEDKKFIPKENKKYDGNLILNFFGIDPNRFADVFISYKGTKKGGKPDDDNVTSKIDKEKFIDFIKSIVGYGYILIHEIGNKVYYTDLRTEDDMNNLIGSNISSVIVYYPNNGGSKIVKVVAELDKTIFTFSFRNKHGGIYPADLTVNFKQK